MSVSNFLKEGRAEISLQLGTIGEGLIYTHIPQRPNDLIIKSLDALETWDIEGVEQPSQFEINGSYFLGTKITISQDKSL